MQQDLTTREYEKKEGTKLTLTNEDLSTGLKELEQFKSVKVTRPKVVGDSLELTLKVPSKLKDDPGFQKFLRKYQ